MCLTVKTGSLFYKFIASHCTITSWKFTLFSILPTIKVLSSLLNEEILLYLCDCLSLFFRHLRYVGEPDMVDKGRQALVRTCIDVGTSDNVVTFLQEMGFRLDYEFVTKGYLLRKGRMKVTISRIYRVSSSFLCCKLLRVNIQPSLGPLSLSACIYTS